MIVVGAVLQRYDESKERKEKQIYSSVPIA